MREVGAFEAKNRLGALLDQVERGEEIVITRRGKPVAKLVPAGPGFDRVKARQAIAGLLEASRAALLERVGEAGGVAPALWPLEALNRLLVSDRRGRLDAARQHRLAGFLRALPITR